LVTVSTCHPEEILDEIMDQKGYTAVFFCYAKTIYKMRVSYEAKHVFPYHKKLIDKLID
jgi:hypothetical protein